VQIKQYLLCSAEQLTDFPSPAATASQLTSSMLLHLSLLCRRRKPAAGTCVDNTAKLRPQAFISFGTTTMYMQRKTSGAAGNGLYTTIKYMRGAAGIGLGTTIKYLRRTTRGAANNGPRTTIKYLVN
jgi:hypothetical protein